MSKQVLIEYFSFQPSPQSLTEAKLSSNRNLIVSGVVQRAESKNQNGRIYRKETLERETEKYIAGPIAENRALGELDHPESSIINIKNEIIYFPKHSVITMIVAIKMTLYFAVV